MTMAHLFIAASRFFFDKKLVCLCELEDVKPSLLFPVPKELDANIPRN